MISTQDIDINSGYYRTTRFATSELPLTLKFNFCNGGKNMSAAHLKPGLQYIQTITVDERLTVPAVANTFTGFADMLRLRDGVSRRLCGMDLH
jgi:hypothetical protein